MRRSVAERLSRHDLLTVARAAGADVDEDTSRARLLEVVEALPEDGAEGRFRRSRENHKWSAEEVAVLQGHPDWTAEELAQSMGVTVGSVEYARKRYGRYAPRGAAGLCVVCDARPVYVESPEAKRLGLCKGCWQEEQRRRLEEEPEAVRLRQAKKRAKGGPDVQKPDIAIHNQP